MDRRADLDVSSLSIRIAVEADVPAVVELINAAYRVEEFFISGDRTDADDIREHMTEGEFLLAESADIDIHGCVYVRTRGDRGYFGMLSVALEGQGSGLGRFLVDSAEQHCFDRDATVMDLLVVNLRAELPPWYERLGYNVTGTEPFEVPGQMKQAAHFIKMSKKLWPRSKS